MKTTTNELIDWLDSKTKEAMNLNLMKEAVIFNLVKMKCKEEMLSLEEDQIKEHFKKGFSRSKTALLNKSKVYSEIYFENLQHEKTNKRR